MNLISSLDSNCLSLTDKKLEIIIFPHEIGAVSNSFHSSAFHTLQDQTRLAKNHKLLYAFFLVSRKISFFPKNSTYYDSLEFKKVLHLNEAYTALVFMKT